MEGIYKSKISPEQLFATFRRANICEITPLKHLFATFRRANNCEITPPKHLFATFRRADICTALKFK